MNRYKLERFRIQCLSLHLIAWFSFIRHCRHPKKIVSIVLNKNVQGLQVSYFLQQNNHIQAAYSEQSVNHAKAQIGVKHFCGEC